MKGRTENLGLRLVIVSLWVVAMAGCSGMSVNSDFDPTKLEEMGGYQSYSWLPRPKGDSRTANQFVAQRIRSVADEVLSDKGYRLDNSSTPDFRIGWQAALDTKLSYNTVNSYYGYGWGYWGGAGYSRTYVTEYNLGTLIIDIVDGSANELVWRGVAQAEVYPQSTSDYRNQRMETAVRKILAQFPPKNR
jgi:hypothetical protein